MILSTGAILDKEFEPGDYVDGRKYGVKKYLSTFMPCKYCQNPCKRVSYGKCDDAYFIEWKKHYAQRPIDSWLDREDRGSQA